MRLPYGYSEVGDPGSSGSDSFVQRLVTGAISFGSGFLAAQLVVSVLAGGSSETGDPDDVDAANFADDFAEEANQ